MKKINFYGLWALALLLVILAFAAIDYLFHLLRPGWAVPEYYFRNKIIFGWLWSIPALIIAWRFSRLWQKSLIFSAIIAVILQARYYWEGFPKSFVFIFLVIHFAILYLLSSVMFYQADKFPHLFIQKKG